jgi:MFS family permease
MNEQPEAGASGPPVVSPDASSDGTPPGRSNRSALFVVFLVVFIDLLGFGIVLPLLPLYASDLLLPLFPGEEAGPRVLRGSILGGLMASFSFMQFVAAPIWGRISDRVGRRPILLLGLVGSVVFYFLFGVASELGARGHLQLALVLMFVSRLGAGLAGATIATAQAVIADTTPPDRQRARGMALIGAAFGIGFTFGPLLGFASLFVDSAGAPGFAAALFSAGALAIALMRLPETLGPGSRRRERHWLDWGGLRVALSSPTVGTLILTFFLATFAFGGLESTLALVNRLLLTGSADVATELTRETLKTSAVEKDNFLVFAYIGLVLMLVQGFLYRRLVQSVGEVRFMRLGLVLMTLGLLGGVAILFAIDQQAAGRTMMLVSALVMFTIAVMGFAFLTPSVQALISRRSDPARQGEILGVNQSASALARILGPFLAITLFFVLPSHILPYLIGAALMGGALLLSLRIRSD